MHLESIPSPAADLVERWLTERLSSHSFVEEGATGLPSRTVSELLQAVRVVLLRRPTLAQAARRLSAYDQFRLTPELVRAAVPEREARPALSEPFRPPVVLTSAVCSTRAPSRRRRRDRG